MASKLKEPEFFPRDGTSQRGRALAALDPEYVRVDERTIQDLVAFAREVGKGLVYHGLDDQPAGDWSAFIGSLEPEVVAAFLEHPERTSPATSPALFRPHFVLFLAFLKLFQKAQGEINDLTRRHLELYYRRVLRMARKGPVPDRVHLLFDLARGEREILVAAGSLLGAGRDSLGREQVYATEQPIVVNRIEIAKKSSVFVERMGLRQTLERHLERHPTDDQGAALALFETVLGDPLPRYSDGTVVDFARLAHLRGDLDLADLPRLRDLMKQAVLPGAVAPAPADQAKIAAVRAIDRYFFMPAESFAATIDEVTGKDARSWEQVFPILEQAHREKSRAGQRDLLRRLHRGPPGASLTRLIRYVLGEDDSEQEDPDAVARLEPYLGKLDFTALEAALAAVKDERPAEGDPLLEVYRLLEVAQRNRLGERPAQREGWFKLSPAEDAAAAGARRASDGSEGSPRWATFGLARPADQSVPAAPVLGWAISSPLLFLSEGKRDITLTLALRPDGVDPQELRAALAPLTSKPLPLIFQVSTAAGWVECTAVEVTVDSCAKLSNASPEAGDPLGIRFVLTLEESVDPIAPLPAKPADIDSPWPSLRLMQRPIGSNEDKAYLACHQRLARLSLVAVEVKVEARGLRALQLQNDETTLDAKKPFEPFGRAPAVGSRLLIGHPEVVTRRLDSLTFTLQWMGAPSDLAAHYAGYLAKDVDTTRLTVQVAMIDRGKETELLAKARLFETEASAPTAIEIGGIAGPEAVSAGALGEDLSTWRRHLQWKLDGSDFGHAGYPALASSKAFDLAAAIANKETIDASDYKLSPPYTPKLASLKLDYTSSLKIRLDAGPPDARAVRVFHIHPFGHCDVHRDADAKRLSADVPFLPRYDHDGELYLGLEGVSAPQSVSLLFQLAEGSANPDLPPQPVAWSYLDGDRWRPFAHRVLHDTTGGLISSGIVELGLDAVAPSTRLRGGLYWIRAAVARDTAAVCDTIDIHPQAVSAVFVDHDNAPDHFRKPLPDATIKKLGVRIPGIAGVRQPYTSRGGRMAEDPGMWATRVSERLRHKQRALSMWDHERLVLERFPQIYKVRCLPARPEEPGKVQLIVIPDIRDLLPSDPFEPRAPSSLLAKIEGYLQDKTPTFAEVSVRNARYVHVLVRLAVRFKGDGNDGFYRRTLNDELNRFLSPWAFEEGSDIVLGGRIYANSIVDFVDRRDYVDYVAAVRLFRSADGKSYRPAPAPPEGEGDFVAADRPDAVLVAARSHEINVLRGAVYDETSMSGINFMKVELDFIVA